MKINFYTIVWGKFHTDMFLRFGLPSIMSKDNIPILQKEHKLSFDIFTKPKDMERILASPLINRLSEICKVNMTTIKDDTDFTDNPGRAQGIMNKHLKMFLQDSFGKGAYCKIITPDVIVGNGSFKPAGHLKGLVIPCGAIRVSAPKFCENKFTYEPDGSLCIEPNTLAKIALKNLHQETIDHFIDSKNFHPNPGMVIFPAGEGCVVKSFVSQPYFLKADNDPSDYKAIEWDYFKRAVPHIDDLHIFHKSLYAFEAAITPDYLSHHMWGPNTFDPQKFADFVRDKYDSHTKDFFRRGYSIGDCDDSANQRASDTGKEILDRL